MSLYGGSECHCIGGSTRNGEICGGNIECSTSDVGLVNKHNILTLEHKKEPVLFVDQPASLKLQCLLFCLCI